jgi:hypothetical protein
MMKRMILMAIAGPVILLFAAWGTLGFPRPVLVGPRIAVENPKRDLGDQVVGTTIKPTFTIKNVGDAPLTMTVPRWPDVIEGCCPSQPELAKDYLLPGESTTVSLEVSMHKGMGGKHLFQIQVSTNDPQQPRATLEVASNWVDRK